MTKEKKVIILLVGWCPPTVVDEDLTESALVEAYDWVETTYPTHQKVLVAGLTNVGVMKVGYPLAAARNWHLVGIACRKVEGYEQFPVDEKHIIGESWGDESPVFTSYAIQSGHRFGIINIAGGRQSTAEMMLVGEAHGFVIYRPLGREVEGVEDFLPRSKVRRFFHRLRCFFRGHPYPIFVGNGVRCGFCGYFKSTEACLRDAEDGITFF